MPTIMLCAGSPLLSTKRNRSSHRTFTRGANASNIAACAGRFARTAPPPSCAGVFLTTESACAKNHSGARVTPGGLTDPS